MWKKNSRKLGNEDGFSDNDQAAANNGDEQTLWAKLVFGGQESLVLSPSQWFETDTKVIDTVTSEEAQYLSEFDPNLLNEQVLEPEDFSGLERTKFTDSQLGLSIIEQFNEIDLQYEFGLYRINAEGQQEHLFEGFGDDPYAWPYNYLRIYLGLASGKVVATQLEILRRRDGSEFAYWSTHLIASNLHMALGTGLGDGELVELLEYGPLRPHLMTEKYSIPRAMLKIAFLAETRSIHTALANRSKIFHTLPREYYPKPSYSILEFEEVWVTNATITQGGEFRGFIAPNAVKFGWTLDAPSMRAYKDSATDVIILIKDGLIRALECVEEGWETARGLVLDESIVPESVMYLFPHNQVADYDFVFGNPALAIERTPGTLDGLPTWVAQTSCLDLIVETEAAMDELGEKTGRSHGYDLSNMYDDLEKVLMSGMGPLVPVIANTLATSFMIPVLLYRSDDGRNLLAPHAEALMQILKEHLSKAVLSASVSQRTNALVTMGVAYFQIGELDKAEPHLLAALKEGAEYAEAESTYILSLLYEEKGDKKSALMFRKRFEKSVGYTPGEWLRNGPITGVYDPDEDSSGLADLEAPPKTSGSSGLSKSSNSSGFQGNQPASNKSSGVTANFCPLCGTKFGRHEEKFCMNCGEPRVS
jgi:tetratricopeptide (TPR) repeat protein